MPTPYFEPSAPPPSAFDQDVDMDALTHSPMSTSQLVDDASTNSLHPLPPAVTPTHANMFSSQNDFMQHGFAHRANAPVVAGGRR